MLSIKQPDTGLTNIKTGADIVIDISEPGYIDVFNQAWQEFSAAKQAVSVE
jgi:hypothetical protein